MSKFKNIDLFTTLLTNGFQIDKTDRFANSNIILNIRKFDKLGAEVKYSILFTDNKEELGITSSLITVANDYNAKPIIVCDNFKSTKCISFTFKEFFSFFGGLINTGLLLIPDLPNILESLGKNLLPKGLEGDPDTLHEIYVKESLQFILQSPTRSYGQDRLFESLPDGLVICKNKMQILYDSKAYSKGFDFSADDIKRFASYVIDFNDRYSRTIGEVFTFTVITGRFKANPKTIQKRSDYLYSLCSCKLSCIESRELGDIVQQLQIEPEVRSSIDWKHIFSALMINKALVNKEISRIKKDNIY